MCFNKQTLLKYIELQTGKLNKGTDVKFPHKDNYFRQGFNFWKKNIFIPLKNFPGYFETMNHYQSSINNIYID